MKLKTGVVFNAT